MAVKQLLKNKEKATKMKNETKRDVLDKLTECYAEVYDAYTDETGSPYYCDDEPNYLDEYDAALPDDMSVIPNAVGEWIKKCKMNNVTLADMLCMEMRPQAVKWWMAFRDGKIANGFDSKTYRCRQETMAKAWIQDAWIDSETGEIVHL